MQGYRQVRALTLPTYPWWRTLMLGVRDAYSARPFLNPENSGGAGCRRRRSGFKLTPAQKGVRSQAQRLESLPPPTPPPDVLCPQKAGDGLRTATYALGCE